MNRTLKDLVRAMLLHKNVPEEFWADAVVTAAYIRNRTTSRGLPSSMTRPRSLDSCSSEALMIGYASNQKSYKLGNLTKNVVVFRDVTLDEQPSTDAILADIEDPDQR
eukprot:IDg4363t1